VQDVALSWQQAGLLTAGLGVVALGLSRTAVPRLRAAAPFARETTVIAGLYALWQLAGTLSVLGTAGAFSRAEWIERTERAWHLPSEAALQRAVTGHSGVVAQAANLYYATMHFGVLFVFLLWLFLRHRESYRPVRRVLALTTLVCLLIQLVPVAPPRLLPGYIDTAARYGQSVYGLGFGADALSAMPSVHVAWAVLIGCVTVRIGRGPGRWLGPLHAVLTVVVVVVTANHFWADGIVAVALLAACAGLERTVRVAVSRRRAAAAGPADGEGARPAATLLR
jgi:PAP2 superfamily